TVGNASTSTTISSSGATVFGQPVTFTATMVTLPPGSGTPNGSFQFVIDGTARAPVNVDAATGKATLTLSDLAAGNHTVSGNYLGAANFATSSTSGPITQSVGRASTTMSVGTSGPSVFGQTVTFTATLSAILPGGGTPTGPVQFVIDGVAQPNVSMDGAGHASIAV